MAVVQPSPNIISFCWQNVNTYMKQKVPLYDVTICCIFTAILTPKCDFENCVGADTRGADKMRRRKHVELATWITRDFVPLLAFNGLLLRVCSTLFRSTATMRYFKSVLLCANRRVENKRYSNGKEERRHNVPLKKMCNKWHCTSMCCCAKRWVENKRWQ
jgi:hypothetical protein